VSAKTTSVPEVKPADEKPERGPDGPRTPYPVDRPGLTDRPGAAPDYLPGTPLEPPGKM
jgi:hypothetical protein